ncbi:ATP-binding protein [Streptomyces sp. SRF1]|uniref:AlbA family DNA-binding domain-containing protein n=1 Tax=Streptomyces sp. SRF1 TaxID=1549642 RepID=UPI0025AF03A9|nr:ATP-binding protein [Streptomyces sp. SRF1]MDN3057059.1 ATP-binding protein [Streptomyces sp. SRF1]
MLRTIAAMANTYGGLIKVGIVDKAEVDKKGCDRIVGVDAQETIDKIASGCREKFDPLWEPTFIPVPMDDESGRSVLVIRVDANVAPRPLLMDLRAPIRLSGQNSTADRDKLLQLACEERSGEVLPMGQSLMAPRLNQDTDGHYTEDIIFRTGVNLPMREAGTWRPLSELVAGDRSGRSQRVRPRPVGWQSQAGDHRSLPACTARTFTETCTWTVGSDAPSVYGPDAMAALTLSRQGGRSPRVGPGLLPLPPGEK